MQSKRYLIHFILTYVLNSSSFYLIIHITFRFPTVFFVEVVEWILRVQLFDLLTYFAFVLFISSSFSLFFLATPSKQFFHYSAHGASSFFLIYSSISRLDDNTVVSITLAGFLLTTAYRPILLSCVSFLSASYTEAIGFEDGFESLSYLYLVHGHLLQAVGIIINKCIQMWMCIAYFAWYLAYAYKSETEKGFSTLVVTLAIEQQCEVVHTA